MMMVMTEELRIYPTFGELAGTVIAETYIGYNVHDMRHRWQVAIYIKDLQDDEWSGNWYLLRSGDWGEALSDDALVLTKREADHLASQIPFAFVTNLLKVAKGR